VSTRQKPLAITLLNINNVINTLNSPPPNWQGANGPSAPAPRSAQNSDRGYSSDRGQPFGSGAFGGARGGGGGGTWGARSSPSGYGSDAGVEWSSRGGNSSGSGWDRPTRTERSGAGGRGESDLGHWRDGKHVVGSRVTRLEKELYGDANDPSKQHTGINFEKYEDIPVEATGAGVPDPVTAFTHPPLDPVLLENIGFARYATPTPVQKYSIPIIAAKRDLLACAQVSPRMSAAWHPF
jgi:ATP-dependent RNA helicase DDX3X